MTDRGYTVGVILTAHPHTIAHLRTLDVLPDVEAIHVAVLDGLDLATLDVPTRKVVRTYSPVNALPTSHRDGAAGVADAPNGSKPVLVSGSEGALAGLLS